jgi:hypothetical protein
MIATYKAHKNGLLFSNGNYYPKVYDQNGDWKYDFRATTKAAPEHRTHAVQKEKSTVDQGKLNWLTF